MKNWLKSNFFIVASILYLLHAASQGYYSKNYDGYYQVLRFLVCGTSGYFAYKMFKLKEEIWFWILGITALLFNPIIPIHLYKTNWQNIDRVASLIFFVFLFIPKKKTEEK